jgi:hypothetical protein
MKVVGIQPYRVQFASLHAFFPTIKLRVHSVTWGHGAGVLHGCGAPRVQV